MSVDEQIVSKELIKLQEQTQKLMNSEIMQDVIKRDKAMLEAHEKSGLTAQMEQLHKQIVALAPQFFPKPEDIAHTKGKYSVRYKTSETDTERDLN